MIWAARLIVPSLYCKEKQGRRADPVDQNQSVVEVETSAADVRDFLGFATPSQLFDRKWTGGL